MGFFAQIEGPTKQVLNQLFADPDLKIEIRYRLYTGQGAYDKKLGEKPDVFGSRLYLTAIRLRHTQRSKLVGVSDIQVGDELYLLKGDDITDIIGDMSVKDELLNEHGKPQTIKSIDDIFGLAVAVTVQAGAAT